jgi:hypothetical protein
VTSEEITRTNEGMDQNAVRGRRFLEMHVDGHRLMQPLSATYTARCGRLFPKKTGRVALAVMDGLSGR